MRFTLASGLRWSFVVLVALAGVALPDRARAGEAVPEPARATRASVLARLSSLNRSAHFLFGQQNATVWGMYLDGAVVSTNVWFDGTARQGRFTSDSHAVVGDDPAVLGVGLDMLAFEPVEWNRRAVIAQAIQHQISLGGLVTLDWHAPSCDASPTGPERAPLAQVNVNGRDVGIHTIAGGAWFYAEEDYKHAIITRADVPDTLRCVCQIANDLPLTAGPYAGLTGKTWMQAHAKHAAQVLREQGLADVPMIVRPFHEQTGAWFWWGQPYWNCAALLDRPGAVSGPDAYKEMVRTFVSALRCEPGMGELLFAYSPDRLLGARETERFTATENKLADPEGFARDRLRERLVRELDAAGLSYASPAKRAATMPVPDARPSHRTRAGADDIPAGATDRNTATAADIYVAQRRRFYAESYAGDDVFDVLGIDLYHPMARPANRTDLRQLGLQLRVLADEARSRGKPYAWTEAGTYRLQLAQLAGSSPPGRAIVLNDKQSVEDALKRLFDPSDRAALLGNFGLSAAGPIVLDAAERSRLLPRKSEDWFNQQFLTLAKNAKVAYGLVWQTYFDKNATDRYTHYYVPYPGHPDAPSFKRFHADPATCFLRDRCDR